MMSLVMNKKIKYQQSLLIQITPEEKGEHLLKKCFKKLGCSTNQKLILFAFVWFCLRKYCNNVKDKLNKLGKSNVVYQFSCPAKTGKQTGESS